MVTLQEYLNSKYPTPEEKKRVREIKIDYKDKKESRKLDGQELDLSEYPNLEKVEIEADYLLKTKLTKLVLNNPKLSYLYVAVNQLTELDLSNCPDLEKIYCQANNLTNLNLNNCLKLKDIHCFDNQLTTLDLSNLSELETIGCANNYLTEIPYILNPEQLTELRISNNNLAPTDLSIFSQFKNLKELWIGNDNENKIQQGIYNRFEGSLEPLKDLKLRWLDIKNTDLESGWKYLPDSLEYFDYDTNLRLDCKLAQVKTQLEAEIWADITKSFTPKYKKEWLELGFSKEETKEWIINLRLDSKMYDFVNYCQQKNFTLEQVRNQLEELHAEWNSVKKINQLIQKQDLTSIPYEQISDIKPLTQGGFGTISTAEWQDKNVILKTLYNSQELTPELLHEFASHKLFESEPIIQCYGISQDPITKNYILVMEYKRGGNLREYLTKNYKRLNLKKQLIQLHSIAQGLNAIHYKGLVHKDFHVGNILSSGNDVNFFEDLKCYITDLGLAKPVSEKEEEGKIFGVMPYVAPEVLNENPYTQKSDVYSWGIVAYEILTGHPPYPNRAYNLELALEILNGLRPQFKIKIPPLLEELIKKCWDTNPANRPESGELAENLSRWVKEVNDPNSEIYRQCQEAEEFNKTLPAHIRFPQYHLPPENKHSKLINTKQINELLISGVELNSSLTVIEELPESLTTPIVDSELTKEQLIEELEKVRTDLNASQKQINYWKAKYQQAEQKLSELLQLNTSSEYHTMSLEELNLDNINLDELTIQEDPQEESSLQARIEIPPKQN